MKFLQKIKLTETQTVNFKKDFKVTNDEHSEVVYNKGFHWQTPSIKTPYGKIQFKKDNLEQILNFIETQKPINIESSGFYAYTLMDESTLENFKTKLKQNTNVEVEKIIEKKLLQNDYASINCSVGEFELFYSKEITYKLAIISEYPIYLEIDEQEIKIIKPILEKIYNEM